MALLAVCWLTGWGCDKLEDVASCCSRGTLPSRCTALYGPACSVSFCTTALAWPRPAECRYSKLSDKELLQRLLHVCQEEGVAHTPDGLEAVVFTADGDMRQALNNVQVGTSRGWKIGLACWWHAGRDASAQSFIGPHSSHVCRPLPMALAWSAKTTCSECAISRTLCWSAALCGTAWMRASTTHMRGCGYVGGLVG